MTKRKTLGINADGKNIQNDEILTNAIDEVTSGAGVTIDSVVLKDGGAELSSPLVLTEQGASPTNPAATKYKLYPKNDGKLYVKNSSGTEVAFQPSLDVAPSIANAHQVVSIKVDGTGYETKLNVPNYTTTDRDLLANIPTGHVIYNTTTSSLEKFNGATWDAIGGGGGSTWGDITGNLSDQTDLSTALSYKKDLAEATLLVADLPTGGDICTASDIVTYSNFVIAQETEGQSLTLPAPADTAYKKTVKVTLSKELSWFPCVFNEKVLTLGETVELYWDGANWVDSNTYNLIKHIKDFLKIKYIPNITVNHQPVGSAATTVDVYNMFVFDQQTEDVTDYMHAYFPSLTDYTRFCTYYVVNAGSTCIYINYCLIAPYEVIEFSSSNDLGIMPMKSKASSQLSKLGFKQLVTGSRIFKGELEIISPTGNNQLLVTGETALDGNLFLSLPLVAARIPIKTLANVTISNQAFDTAANTVDVFDKFTINQTTANMTAWFPAPTNTSIQKTIRLTNTGSQALNLGGLGPVLQGGSFVDLMWNGTQWAKSAGVIMFENLTTNILADGTVSIGTLNTAARADHVHPLRPVLACSAYRSGASQVSTGVAEKLQFNSTEVNTGSCWSTGSFDFSPSGGNSYYLIIVTISQHNTNAGIELRLGGTTVMTSNEGNYQALTNIDGTTVRQGWHTRVLSYFVYFNFSGSYSVWTNNTTSGSVILETGKVVSSFRAFKLPYS